MTRRERAGPINNNSAIHSVISPTRWFFVHILTPQDLTLIIPAADLGFADAGNYRSETVLGRIQRTLEGFRKACQRRT